MKNLSILLIVLVMSCQHSDLNPISFTGTYTLTTVKGRSVFIIMQEQPDGVKASVDGLNIGVSKLIEDRVHYIKSDMELHVYREGQKLTVLYFVSGVNDGFAGKLN